MWLWGLGGATCAGLTALWGAGGDPTGRAPRGRCGDAPPPPRPHIQVVLALEGLAADLADVFPLLAVRQVVLAEGAGAAEHLPTQAAVEERVLRGCVLPPALPSTPRRGPATFVCLLRHLEGTQPQV